jgi:hypothetical protein
VSPTRGADVFFMRAGEGRNGCPSNFVNDERNDRVRADKVRVI